MSRIITTEMDALLAALARICAHDGKAREVAILGSARASITEVSHDNLNGGTYGYAIHLEIPTSLYMQIAPERELIEKAFVDMIEPFVRRYSNEFIEQFVISTEVIACEGWQEKALAWVAGKGTTNQGRVRSDNIASRTCDGLLFRSQPEIHLYRALKEAGIVFAPLPVVIRGGQSFKRIEPDFLIFRDGILLHVEVDGDTVHQETPVEAHERTTLLGREGAIIERVSALSCGTIESARICAARLLEVIQKAKQNR